jgi:hypothetical protein
VEHHERIAKLEDRIEKLMADKKQSSIQIQEKPKEIISQTPPPPPPPSKPDIKPADKPKPSSTIVVKKEEPPPPVSSTKLVAMENPSDAPRNLNEVKKNQVVRGVPTTNNNMQSTANGKCNSWLKIYVYEFPEDLKFNKVAAEYLADCRSERGKCDSQYGGENLLAQFSLELILADFFRQSCTRTMDPEEADLFYVPYYNDVEYRCVCVRCIYPCFFLS